MGFILRSNTWPSPPPPPFPPPPPGPPPSHAVHPNASADSADSNVGGGGSALVTGQASSLTTPGPKSHHRGQSLTESEIGFLMGTGEHAHDYTRTPLGGGGGVSGASGEGVAGAGTDADGTGEGGGDSESFDETDPKLWETTEFSPTPWPEEEPLDSTIANNHTGNTEHRIIANAATETEQVVTPGPVPANVSDAFQAVPQATLAATSMPMTVPVPEPVSASKPESEKSVESKVKPKPEPQPEAEPEREPEPKSEHSRRLSSSIKDVWLTVYGRYHELNGYITRDGDVYGVVGDSHNITTTDADSSVDKSVDNGAGGVGDRAISPKQIHTEKDVMCEIVGYLNVVEATAGDANEA